MENYDTQSLQKYITRKRLILVCLLVLVVGVVFWLYNHTYIVVTVPDATANKSIVYEFTDQKSKEIHTQKSKTSSIKKLLPKGDYEVTVKSDSKSYFEVVKTRGFLATSKVTTNMQTEKSRKFVGNNPGPCMYYTGETLYTYSCSGTFEDMQVHLPASENTPTVVKTAPKGVDRPIGGTFRIGQSNYVLLKTPGEEEARTALYPLNPTFSLANGTVLKDLEKSSVYGAQSSGSGFIAYDQKFEDLTYYRGLNASGEKIRIPEPAKLGDNMSRSAISVHDNRLAVIYSADVEEENLDTETITDGETVVQVYNYSTKKTRSFSFGNNFTRVKLCGTEQLCAINGRELQVYDISGEEAVKNFRVIDVFAIENDGNTLVAMTSSSVLGIDVAKASGSIQYSFGDYKLCNAQAVPTGGYMLCLINDYEDRVALYVDTRAGDTDSVDKKVLGLYKNPDISEISMYGNYVYLTPDLGELEYNPAARGYKYSPLRIKETNRSIDKTVRESGLDTLSYRIINPYSAL